MKKIQLATALIAVTITLSNCKKDPDMGPQGIPGPSLTGNLKGYISHYDEFGGKILTGLSGDTILIDGTTKKAITDSTGLYTLTDLSTGVYSITIKKAGFGINKVQNIQFVGGEDTYRDSKLSQPSTFDVSSLNDSVDAVNGNVTVYGTVAASVQARTFIIYIGQDASVNASTSRYLVYLTKNINANAVKVSFVIPKTDLYDAGFSPGTTAYFAVYGLGSTTASAYEDFTNGRMAFSSLSPNPAVANVVVP